MTAAMEAFAATSPLLAVEGLRKYYPIREGLLAREVGTIKAVDGASFTVACGEVLGVVGESGSGKSTLGRLVLRLVEATAGTVRFDGVDLLRMPRRQLRAFRRNMQMVFQDPFASLNPRMTVGDTLAEAIGVHGLARRREARDRVVGLLRRVGLPPDAMRRYPRAFSGGQRQRIAIARALAVEPRFIVADEPVSALDVSIQAEVINLLADLQRQFQLTMIFISHDLSVIEVIADRVLVLYLGRIVEIGPTGELFTNPRHPYTRALLAAVPGRRDDDYNAALRGEMPSPANPPSGCVFRTRCPFAVRACAEVIPPLTEVSPGHRKACIRDELDLRVAG
jgi:oligopeptide/dipeptide ABC transporter ATP-binding protein